MTPNAEELRSVVSQLALGNRLVSNMYRGLVAEAIVANALGSGWEWCSADWAGWDFVNRVSGLRLEVKQAAEVQTWARSKTTFASATFGIPIGKGHWDGDIWTDHLGRHAQIYVFAYHGHISRETADHFDVEQWRFLVLPTISLPPTQSASLRNLERIAVASRPEKRIDEVCVPFKKLRDEVNRDEESLLTPIGLA